MEKCHTLTGVWIETLISSIFALVVLRHTLTGVWIETRQFTRPTIRVGVTPSRVCGLKPDIC